MKPGAAGILSGAAGIVGSIINNRAADKRAEKAFHRQRQLIDEERAYNDPSMQMQRLKEAGINPHMAYSKGQMQNTVSSSGKGAPMAPTPGINLQGSVQGGLMTAAQLKDLNASVKLKESQANNLDSKSTAQDMENYLNGLSLGWNATVKVDGKVYTGSALYAAWLSGDITVPPAVAMKMRENLKDSIQKQTMVSNAQIAQAEANLKKYGYTFNDDLAVRVGISMAIEKGYDMSTVQGATLAYGLITQILPILTRSGALAGAAKKSAQTSQRSLSGKVKSKRTARTVGQTKRGSTRTTQFEKYEYHE